MSEQDPELGPEEEQRLRALLADLGSGGAGAEPLPTEVADRLEETLAGLLEERRAIHARSPWRPRLAVAAAAVVVLGLGGVAVATKLGGAGAADSSTAGSGVSATQSRPDASASTPSPSGSAEKSAAGSTARSPAPLSGDAAAALPRLSSARFTQGVTSLLGSARSSSRQDTDEGSGQRTLVPSGRPACAGPALTAGSTVTPVTLDSAPAALVVHPAKDGTRLVEAWSCDGTHRLASTTVAP